MSELRQVDFPEKDLPLRNDVSLLGQLLGECLVEQHGPEMLERVEMVRIAAIKMREGDHAGDESLDWMLGSLPVEELRRIVKAFSTYLGLANLAEKVHRIRRRRTYLKMGETLQRGSLEEVLARLATDGAQARDLAEVIAGLRIRPVFTAHPTEATRRSLLEKDYSIVHRLVEKLNPDLTPDEESRALDRIRDAINSTWQTSNVPAARTTVADELDHVLFYLTEILYRVVPAYYESLDQAWIKAFGLPPPVNTQQLLRLGSWVGGDMDGNPYVGAETILATLNTQRRALIDRYVSELRGLARYLSQTRGQAEFSARFEQKLEEYTTSMPGPAADIPERHREMPYRCLLKLVRQRLEDTRAGTGNSYERAADFENDIRLVAESLAANRGRNAGLFGTLRLLRKIETFGFHLATLDIRQDALVHRQVLAELTGQDGWEAASAAQRTATLEQWMQASRVPGTGDTANRSDEALRVLEVFRAIGQARVQFGHEAIGLFIISMTQGADDVLTIMALARLAGWGRDMPMDIAPLLETVEDLQSGPAILEELLGLEQYRQHLADRDNRQVIMVGYSDSNKDSGIVAARWGLYEAQARLVEIGRKHGVNVQFFHGRGGTVSRGGGNLVKGIEGAPPETVNGYLRITEQGEVINQKYGIRPIALRNLELMTGAVLRHELLDTGQHPQPEHTAILAEMAADAREAYRNLVYQTPEFIPYFRKATPIDVIERLAIGSRPASRRTGDGIENLRAIPWVFSWAQVRLGLPGVYGAGAALAEARDRHGIEALRDMHARWSFFQGLINDVEMVLAKSVLDIGERYASLAAPETQPVFNRIRTEFELARDCVLEIRQVDQLLDGQRTLQRNIRLRNPYADPMHIMQIDLLRRWRATGREDHTLLRALKSTVHGIALAIQNTG
jgi:phosphoenolpyruvate carboxylase